jgi:hypothetical protein
MPPQAFDFSGSSASATLALVCNAFGHPEHQGNSKAQKSLYESLGSPPGDVAANRHTKGGPAGLASAMMLSLDQTGAQHSQSPVNVEDGAAMEPEWNFWARNVGQF